MRAYFSIGSLRSDCLGAAMLACALAARLRNERALKEA